MVGKDASALQWSRLTKGIRGLSKEKGQREPQVSGEEDSVDIWT